MIIRNNVLLVIGKEIKSTVSDDFKVSLQSDNPLMKFLLKLLEVCFCHQESCCIWVLYIDNFIQYLANIVDHILGWRWPNVMQMELAAATKQRCLGTSCAVGLLSSINDAKKCCVV
jgi:hypothetical protein